MNAVRIHRAAGFLRSVIPFLLAFGAASWGAAQGLSLSEYRVVFDDRKRAHALTITNRGASPGRYAIELAELNYKPDGGTAYVAADEAWWPIASPYLRFAPRRPIDLAPGESQQVRIALRKGGDLPAGEYRSHLRLVQQFDEDEADQGFALRSRLSLSIPLIVRHQAAPSRADIVGVRYAPGGGQRPAALIVTLGRLGDSSIYGELQLSDATSGAVIATVNGAAVHTSAPQRAIAVRLTDGVVLPADRRLRVTFTEQEHDMPPVSRILSF